MTNKIALLPCPLCGNPEVDLRGYANSDGQFVECTNCGVAVEVLNDMNPWNTRTAPVTEFQGVMTQAKVDERAEFEHAFGINDAVFFLNDKYHPCGFTQYAKDVAEHANTLWPAWKARAAISHEVGVPVVPAGWKLVPVEPDWNMLSSQGCTKHHEGVKCLHHENRRRIWDAMLIAAPEPSVADIEPFAIIGDYAACGGSQTVFTPEYAELITDRMCSKTAVYTLGAVGAAVAAINTLNAKGYTYHGAALWRPPLGEKPDFDLIDGARAGGIELAAKWVEARASAYDHEHGSTDPETGTREYPGTGGEYVDELYEIADGIRTLSLNAKVGAEVGDE